MFDNVRRAPVIGLVSAAVVVAACSASASPSPSPTPAAVTDPCLVGTWTVVGQTQNSPANDEDITYTGGEGEIFTIDAQGGLTIDTKSAQPLVLDSANEKFTGTVSGTGHGTVTTGVTGANRVLYFAPSADDTRKTLSVDETNTPLGPARADTPFSAVYTCAPGRFTFYKTAVNYMVDGPIVELVSGIHTPPPASPAPASQAPASPSPS
jgi:hypothetical protein